MRTPAAFFYPIALALGAIILAPIAGARAQDTQEGPIEIEKCQTIDKPGSYKLVKNLKAGANTDCLVITADFVSIDLAGFTITGGASDTEQGRGIITTAPSSGQLQGIAVRNGSISGFFSAVELDFADGSIVEGLRVSAASGGGASGGIFATGIVKGNTASGYGVGISATGTVTGNYANNNKAVGIAIQQGSTAIGNTATNNREFGFSVVCPSNLTDNTAVNNLTNLRFFNGVDGCNNTNNVAP